VEEEKGGGRRAESRPLQRLARAAGLPVSREMGREREGKIRGCRDLPMLGMEGEGEAAGRWEEERRGEREREQVWHRPAGAPAIGGAHAAGSSGDREASRWIRLLGVDPARPSPARAPAPRRAPALDPPPADLLRRVARRTRRGGGGVGGGGGVWPSPRGGPAASAASRCGPGGARAVSRQR